MITKQILQEEFKRHNLYIIHEFLKLCMPVPDTSRHYKYVSIQTTEGITLTVWGATLQDIWDSFQRFKQIRVFL
jgi:hypothetical protein